MSPYTKQQIISILRQHKAGIKAVELCRMHGVSRTTFYHWRSKYGGQVMTETQPLLLRKLENENRLLLADLSGHQKKRWSLWAEMSSQILHLQMQLREQHSQRGRHPDKIGDR